MGMASTGWTKAMNNTQGRLLKGTWTDYNLAVNLRT
jgi:hypothetical protein